MTDDLSSNPKDKASLEAQLAQMRRLYVAEYFRAGGNELARTRAEELAGKDGLTGLLNRRALEEGIETMMAMASRNGSSRAGALVMIDLDHFKNVNDTYGHPMGDAVLKVFAAFLASKDLFRSSDILGRYGGEEFCIYMPKIPAAKAMRKMEMICRLVAGLHETEEGKKGGIPAITASFGLCCFHVPPREELLEVCQRLQASGGDSGKPIAYIRDLLLKQADASLYEAKRSGRNRVVASTCSLEEMVCSLPAATRPEGQQEIKAEQPTGTTP